MAEIEKQIPTKKLKFFGLGKLKPYLSTYKGIFLTLVFCTLIVGVLSTVTPLFQQYAINNFIANKTLDGLWTFILVYVALQVVIVVLDFFGAYGCCRLELFLMRDMRLAEFNPLQTLPVS